MLLLRLHRLALRLRPLLPLSYVFGAVGLVMGLALLLQDAASPQLLALALGLTVWALMLYAFVRLFQTIPPPVLPKDTFLERLLSRCRLALYHLLAFSVALVGLALVVMSFKLVSISLEAGA